MGFDEDGLSNAQRGRNMQSGQGFCHGWLHPATIPTTFVIEDTRLEQNRVYHVQSKTSPVTYSKSYSGIRLIAYSSLPRCRAESFLALPCTERRHEIQPMISHRTNRPHQARAVCMQLPEWPGSVYQTNMFNIPPSNHGSTAASWLCDFAPRALPPEV
jgi:hypothetical protein